MPTDISRSREGENQRSDQARRDASSSNGGRVHDFATCVSTPRKQQRETEQRRDGKGPAEREKHRAIGEDDNPIEKLKLRDTFGLKGGTRTRNDFLSREQNAKYFFIIQNVHGIYRTDEQNRIVKLAETADKIIKKYPNHDYDFIKGKIDRAEVRIYAGLDTNSDNEAGPSREAGIPEGIPKNREDQITALIDKLIERQGQFDQWKNDKTDIRHFISKKYPMTKAEYSDAKKYMKRFDNLGSQHRKNIKNSLAKTYTE